MSAPVIDTVTTTAPARAASDRDEARAADLLTFKVGMTMVAVVLTLMAVVGVVVGSPLLVVTAGLTGSVATMVGVYTGINIIAA
ncbi:MULTISPECIES: mandelate racemase [unclassified Actinomyces]|uniref:mandelate racemase n=1 Tax=unclassified Actinomyces TaxID=2609248 RepID=UPI0020173E50|nr:MULTISPECIES: mandelate racemase [unclassified Actinomyces]MCL3777617.1 mandelate racemase [Actinomyces sp. AC-20-1]MCL3789437.1 mandelate racemase [Actinomyces sp. 187325]MCL3791183.1 mandelate racemase [Actinomyces sp. 186855]MCL3794423.1 mandelate racemase [Actinomyces sp. 217892]